jgi:acyl dehydratase
VVLTLPDRLEDLPGLVGTRAGPTGWRTIEQRHIDLFATLSGDAQWIHVDAERAAREAPWGTTIAHGNLTLALVDGFRDELVRVPATAIGINLGYDRVRFPAPVPAGSRLRGHLELTAAHDAGDGWWRLEQRFTVELEGSAKPACVAVSIVRVALTTPGPPAPR